jgi:hypothetical protein
MFLYVYVAYASTIWLPNLGWLQDAIGDQDVYGGHQIGDTRLIRYVSY